MSDPASLRDAIQAIVKDEGYVTRCLVIVETLKDDTYSFQPMWDGLLSWDVKGWLQHAADYLDALDTAVEAGEAED
jgi:hypothetical protein